MCMCMRVYVRVTKGRLKACIFLHVCMYMHLCVCVHIYNNGGFKVG